MIILDYNINIKPKIEYIEWLNVQLKLLHNKCNNLRKIKVKILL
jgi:hypothetical protein